MDYEKMMDERQKHVHEHFPANSKLSDPEFVKKLLDWLTFWRRNPSRFVQRYFGITLYLYQHIILYLMDIFPSICIVAAPQYKELVRHSALPQQRHFPSQQS